MRSLIVSLLVFAVSFVFLTGVALAGDAYSTAASGATADLALTQNGSTIPMNVVPQDLKFPQLIPYFGPDNPGFRFRPIEDILLYGNTFTIKSLQAGLSYEVLTQNGLTKVTNSEALKQVVTVIFTGAKNVSDKNYTRRGFVMARASGDSTSLDALQLTLLLANKMGSSVVHLTRQGVDFSMHASGWGISLGGVKGSLSSDESSGTVASGMLGYASGKAGANKDPWIQGVALEPLP